MSVSRRDFLKGAGCVGVGAMAAVGLGGCTPASQEGAGGAAQGSGDAQAASSWETPPALPDESEIAETIDTEICILGAGCSGTVAALVAAEAGAQVVVMQNKEAVSSQGSGASAFGSSRQTETFDNYFRTELIRLKASLEGGLVNYNLLNLWLDRSGEAIDWVLDRVEPAGMTASFDAVENWKEADDWAKTCPIMSQFMGPNGGGAAEMAQVLAASAEDLGVQFIFSTTAKQLIREGDKSGRVVAALGQREDGTYVRVNASKGVIVCTGGYEGNAEMRDKYLAHANKFRAITENMGEGIQMGMWIGADVDPAPHASNIHYNYLPSDPFGSGLPWLRVNKEGRRLGNEDIAYSYLPFLDVNSEEPVCFQIFDSDYEEYYEKMVDHGAGIFRSCPSPEFVASAVTLQTEEDTSDWSALDKTWQYYLELGTMIKKDTLEEIAEEYEIDYEELQKTVDRYNQLYDEGFDADYGKMHSRMQAIRTPPFYAIRREACVLGTLNGLVVNTNLQVLDTNREVIPGLYAAGNASGGRFFGGVAQGMSAPASTVSRAIVWGYLAAQNLCAE